MQVIETWFDKWRKLDEASHLGILVLTYYRETSYHSKHVSYRKCRESTTNKHYYWEMFKKMHVLSFKRQLNGKTVGEVLINRRNGLKIQANPFILVTWWVNTAKNFLALCECSKLRRPSKSCYQLLFGVFAIWCTSFRSHRLVYRGLSFYGKTKKRLASFKVTKRSLATAAMYFC